MTATELLIEGDLGAEGLADWICARARLLDLSGWVARPGPGRVSVVVSGPEPLVGAMEMACSLGPVDVMVDRIETRPHPLAEVPDGFHKR